MINTIKIENRRKKLNITKYRMADKLGMSRQTYYSILNTKSTTLKTLEKIASILDLKARDLII
jgi:DNA-binding XRE family transcriptional regulator